MEYLSQLERLAVQAGRVAARHSELVNSVLGALFGVAKAFLYFAFLLACFASGLLVWVTSHLADLALDFASGLLERAFDLILVHNSSPCVKHMGNSMLS